MSATNLISICCIMLIAFSRSFGLDTTDISHSLFGNKSDGWSLGAIADFNGDKSTDLLLFSNENKEMGVLLMADFGYTQTEKLHPETYVKLWESESREAIKSVSVIPGDFNNDNNMDFYLYADGKLYLYICSCKVANTRLVFCNPLNISCVSKPFRKLDSEEHWLLIVEDEPMLLDINGDWIPDIIVKENGKFTGFLGQTNSTVIEINLSDYINSRKPPSSSTIPKNLFTSLDNDMVADILLDGHVYTNDNAGKFSFVQSLPEAAGFSGLPLAVSIENPVTQLELIIPASSSPIPEVVDSKIKIYPGGSLKRLAVEATNSTWKDVMVHLPPYADGFAWVSAVGDIELPIPALRSGDYDLDGYSDFISVVALTNSASNFHPQNVTVVLFRNSECNSGRCFEMVDLFRGKRSSTTIPLVAAFVDVTPDARLAAIATFYNMTEKKPKLVAQQISAPADLAFLKVSVSLNLRTDEITASNLPGGMVQCKVSSMRNRVPLLQRSSHTALALPYALFGLGTLPPFVDELAVQLTSSKPREGLFKHQLIIPNSQLVLLANPDTDPLLWPLKSFLLLNWYMFAVLGLLGVLTVVSLIMLGGLQFRDKRIEKKEKEEEAQQFHFDGM